MKKNLEHLLAFHCGPTLAGIKAGSLVSCCRAQYPELKEAISRYNESFRRMDVRFEILCTCDRSSLLLVYRPSLLAEHLSAPLARKLLKDAEYPVGADLEALLEHLSLRLRFRNGDFPHEIGLFLGYPPEDVEGFQLHRGQNCKLCGHWKVYSNVERAEGLFRRYDRCRDALCRRLAQGHTMNQVFRNAS